MRQKLQTTVHNLTIQIKQKGQRFIQDERGEIMGSLGWMAIIAVVLVAIHGLLTGWLPTFINDIFAKMETLL
ncbi:MAG: hypothetical protein WAO24_02750 [Peptococcia bacterium]